MACIQKKENEKNKKDNCTIRKIPDELWDEISNILPKEKPPKTVGRPIVPFRKVMDGIVYVLRTGCQWKMLILNMVPVPPATEDFRNGLNWMFSKGYGLNC